MNRLYTYFPKFDENENLVWLIHETVTDQIISEFYFEDDAHEYCNFLEYGGAFNGFTPSFMLTKAKITDIDSMFEMEFSET